MEIQCRCAEFWKFTRSISMSPATGSLLLCVEILNLPCFSAALLETAKVLVFLLSLVFHVFGVLISLWLHHKKYWNINPTNAVGLPKGWKTAHIFAHKDPHPAKPTHHLVGGRQGQVRRCLKPFMPSICSLQKGFTLIEDGLRFLNHF